MQKEKKKYLNQYLQQEIKINSLSQMERINPERKFEYKKVIAECKLLRKEIETKIYSVDDFVLREVLIQKYIFGKTLEETALILNYSKRHIERLHVKALEIFEI